MKGSSKIASQVTKGRTTSRAAVGGPAPAGRGATSRGAGRAAASRGDASRGDASRGAASRGAARVKVAGSSPTVLPAVKSQLDNLKDKVGQTLSGFILAVVSHLPSATTMLLLVTLGLFGFGLTMGFSASFVNGRTGYTDLFDQLRFVAYGLIAVAVLFLGGKLYFSKNRKTWHTMVSFVWLLSLLSMLLVFVPGLGINVNGAYRWLNLPLLPQFQPSEFAKIAVVLFVASTIERIRNEGLTLYGWILIASYSLMLVLAMMQKDLGTAVLMHLGLISVMLLGDMPLVAPGIQFATSILFLTVVPLIAVAVTFFFGYRQARWAGFFCSLDPASITEQLAHADQLRNGFLALGSGGLSGLGPGLSKQKYFYLSFHDTDFIYAIVGEELGLIGAMAVVLLFLLFAWFGLRVAKNAASDQGRMIAGGATAMIAGQALVNIAGVVGAAPLTGKPLPFFSLGGSSMMTTVILVGCIFLVALFDNQQQSAFRQRSQLRVVDGNGERYDSRYDEARVYPKAKSNAAATLAAVLAQSRRDSGVDEMPVRSGARAGTSRAGSSSSGSRAGSSSSRTLTSLSGKAAVDASYRRRLTDVKNRPTRRTGG